jgi:hypothetical protein
MRWGCRRRTDRRSQLNNLAISGTGFDVRSFGTSATMHSVTSACMAARKSPKFRRRNQHQVLESMTVRHVVERLRDPDGESLFRLLMPVRFFVCAARNAIAAQISSGPIAALFARRWVVLFDLALGDQFDFAGRAQIAQEQRLPSVADHHEGIRWNVY